MFSVERLTDSDRDEALRVLNHSFSFKETAPGIDRHSDFESNLPIMWTGEHDYMSRHLAVKENGRIVSMLGVYPLRTVIAGDTVLMGTIGNVATLPESRGKGYMRLLFESALREAEALGMAAARLSGLRSRYTRYDFDHAGSVLIAEMTQRNAADMGPVPSLRFVPIGRDDGAAIDFARACREKSGMYVIRETQLDFYCALCAWKNRPLLALTGDGIPVGYLSVSPAGGDIAEWGTSKEITCAQLMAAYLRSSPDIGAVTFRVMPFDIPSVTDVRRYAERWRTEAASMFRVFRWEQLLPPLLKLASRTRKLQEGSLTIGIAGQDTLLLTVHGSAVSVQRTKAPADIVLTRRDALAALLGDIPFAWPSGAAGPQASWFPLPLSWCGQDRV